MANQASIHNVSPPNLAKFRRSEIGCYNDRIALKFHSHFGSGAAEESSKVRTILKDQTRISRLRGFARSWGETSVRFVNKVPSKYNSCRCPWYLPRKIVRPLRTRILFRPGICIKCLCVHECEFMSFSVSVAVCCFVKKITRNGLTLIYIWSWTVEIYSFWITANDTNLAQKKLFYWLRGEI